MFWQAFRRHVGLDHDSYVVGSFRQLPGNDARTGRFGRIEGHCQLGSRLWRWSRTHAETRRFRHDARRRKASTFIWHTAKIAIKAVVPGRSGVCLGRRRGGPHERLVARCPSPLFRSAGQSGRVRTRRRYPTVFERFEVVWPLGVR
jgi:hypothetical protein